MTVEQENDEGLTATDIELIEKLKVVFRHFIGDQKEKKPRYKAQGIPDEMNGWLSDIMYRDRVDNQLLVGFIAELLYQAKTDQEILWLLKAIYSVLDSFEVGFMWDNTIQLIQSSEIDADKVMIDINHSDGVIKLASSLYKLEITINQKWIGYDFQIQKSVLGRVYGRFVDTDLYPLDTNPKMTQEMYDEVHLFLKNFLAGKLYYGLKDSRFVFAMPNQDGTYRVTLTPKRRFFATISVENWSANKIEHDTDLIALKVNSD